MKHFSQRGLSFLLVLCIVTALFVTSVFAKNTDRRGTDCTSLSSQATAYYTGNYTYDTMSKLQGGTTNCLTTVDSTMYKQLQTLMKSTMTNSVSYKALTNYWPATDNSIYFYSNTGYGGNVSREHVWPKSHATFHQSGGGSDLHHLRPEDAQVNSRRWNYTMGNVKSTVSNPTTYDYEGKVVLWYSPDKYLVEVPDYVKGDVARILLYVYVRWEEPNLFMNDPSAKPGPGDEKNDGIKVIESLDTLLEWCELDPVDTWEMKRNDEVQNIQGNRNVFIDYPEYSWLLFGQKVPNDMTTPSGEAKNGTPTVCKHTNTKNEHLDAICTTAGYDRTVCADCGATVKETTLPALGHDYKSGACTRCGAADPNYKPDCKHENVEHQHLDAACTTAGYDRDVCKDCGKTVSETTAPALGHDYKSGKCTRCGAADPNAKPANTPKYTDFADLPVRSWYKDAVSYALENGLMNGVARREFDPEGELTRAMFVTILYRAEGSPDMTGKTAAFTDVPAGQWYSDAVVWATENRIVNGTSAATYEPDAPITREQIATILFRYSKAAKTDNTLASFPDAGTVSGYAYDAMCWAVSEGIINGSDGRLVPQDNATRVQIAAILMRYLEK